VPGMNAIVLFASGGLLLLLDQWGKRMVEVHVGRHCISWGRALQLRYVVHMKDIYKHRTARAALVLVWFAALVSAIALHRSGVWFQSRTALFGLSLALGGAAGNLLDVVRRRYIIDFIDMRWWPVFNLSDVAIVAGLAAAFWPQS
jgi:signal peptidase II